MIKRLLLVAFAIVSAVMISSCASNFGHTKQTIAQTKHDIHESRTIANTEAPPVIELSGYYVDNKPMAISNRPKWVKRHISLSANDMPLNLLVNQILRNTPATITYQKDMNDTAPVTINYSGTIQGALNEAAAKTGYAYQINANKVNWQALIMRTFNISFMPGTSNYMVGQNAGASSGSSAASGSGDIVTVRGNLGNEQYSNLSANALSIWNDLRASLDQMKSKQGKVWVSEATTTVTVKDHPGNVAEIATYIQHLNKIMSEQVSIHVQVLELSLKNENAYGVDWNKLLATIRGTKFTLGGKPAEAAIIGAATGLATTGGLTTLNIQNRDGDGAILNALAEQGRLSVVTEPTVVTMNNQVAEIRITKDTGYLQSVSTTSANLTSTESTLTPGIVTDGFSLYLLPKIQGNRVYLQISSSLSTLEQLKKISNAPSDLADIKQNNQQNAQNFEAIQVPTLEEKHFNQRTVLLSGSTLMISGFQQLRDEFRKIGAFGTKIPAGMGEQNRNVQTIVLITPVIIRNQ